MNRRLPLLIAAALPAVLFVQTALADGCSDSARALRYACEYDARDDFFTANATCQDSSMPDDACFEDSLAQRDETAEECQAVLEARLALCELLGDAPHEPAFGEAFAADFVDPLQIGAAVAVNPYFPLVPGNQWVYEGGAETITVTVLAETKLIDGVTCIVVNDVVEEDGVLIEDTDDWYAQDLEGNVWYCGEIAQNYELFDGDNPEEAELVDIGGSWKAGRDGAKAGILLPRNPNPGDVIRQEVLYTDAEDAIEILRIDATENAPGGACAGDCLETRDFTPLEPGAEALKYYAPGIGLILELEDGERVELIEFTGVGS